MRIFVAVEVSDHKVIDAISKFQSNVEINAKPVEPHNLHFTLQFLGEVPKEKVEDVRKALKEIDFSNFEVDFRGVGAFPKMKFPRVIWIGTDKDGGDALVNLARKVSLALEPLKFTSDKPFKPHITVFRIKNQIGDITEEMKKFGDFNFGRQKISNFKLKQSVLTPKGPVYTDLEEVKGR